MVDPGSGELVPDDSRVVVMDGLLTERERGALLSWLTADGWDHRAGPPEARWERACVDREGDAATWGLRCVHLPALTLDPCTLLRAGHACVLEVGPAHLATRPAKCPCAALPKTPG